MFRFFNTLVVAGMAAGVLAPAAADDERTVDVSFEELPSGWEVDWAEGGNWYVDGGMLIGEGHAWFSYTEHDWDDLRVEFAVQMSGGLHVNMRAGEERYRFALRQDDGGTRIEIRRDADGESRLVAASEPDGVTGDLDVSISVIGGFLEIRADELYLSWNDRDPLPPGRFGFESLGDTAWVQIGPVRMVGTVPTVPPEPPPPTPTTPPTPIPPSAEGPDPALVNLVARPISSRRLEVAATVVNTGDSAGRPGVLIVEFHDDPLGEFVLDENLAPGAELSVTETLDVPERWWSTAGAVTAWVEAIEGEDADGSNNWRSFDLELPPLSQPPTQTRTSDPVRPADPVVSVEPPTQTRISDPVRRDESPSGVEVSTPGTGGGNPIWPYPVSAGVVAVAGTLIARRLLRNHRQQRAEDTARRGQCRPDRDRYTQREIEPDLAARKITSVEMTPVDQQHEQRQTSEFDDESLLGAFNAALSADRVLAQRHRDDAIATAAQQLAELVVSGAVGEQLAGLQLAAKYEGSKVPATFTTWRCSPDGTWPEDDSAARRRWKADVTDAGSATSRSLAIRYPLDRGLLALELGPLVGEVIDQIDERRHPRPHAHAHAEFDA